MSDKTVIGNNTKIWHEDKSNIYPEGVIIGTDCNIGTLVEIRKDVKIGDRVKIQAFTFIPEGVTIGNDVFIGPHVCFTNDGFPRASKSCPVRKTVVKDFASIGANATILPGVIIGKNAMVGAGSVVTKDVPANTVVAGNPAKVLRELPIEEKVEEGSLKGITVVGIVAMDWANAAWNVFQALKGHGMDAHLINLNKFGGPFKNYQALYDVGAWTNEGKKKAKKLIQEADVYQIFESGGTLSMIDTGEWRLKDRPRLMCINSSTWYKVGPKQFKRHLKPRADMFACLTINMPIEEAELGLQPLHAKEYAPRKDYSLKTGSLMVGGAPGYQRTYKSKRFDLIKKKIKNMDIVMDATQEQLKARMQKHDVFTNGIFVGAYGYSMIQAAMFGTPCMAWIKERDKSKLLIDGEFPILEMGQDGQNIPKIMELMKLKENRARYGKLTARWARKYHSYKACYNTYRRFYAKLLMIKGFDDND